MSTPFRSRTIVAASLWVLFAAASAPGQPPTTAPERDPTPTPDMGEPPAPHPAEPGRNTGSDEGDGQDAIALYARGDYAAVVKRLDPEFRGGRASIQQRLLLARAMLHLDRRDDGLTVLRDVLKTDSANPEANGLAGRVLFDQGKHAESAELLEQAWKLRKDPFIAGTLGQCYYALGETPKAKEYLTAALAEDIRNPQNSLVLGKICLERGAGAEAEKYLLMAQDAGLDSIELHHLLGKAYLLQRKYIGPVLIKRLPGEHKPGDIVDDCVVLARQEGVADQYQVCTKFCALYEGYQVLRGLERERAAHPDMLERVLEAAATQPELHDDAWMLVVVASSRTIDHVGVVPVRKLTEMDAQYMVAIGWYSAGRYDSASQQLEPLLDWEFHTRRTRDLQARLQIATKDFAGLDKTLASASEKKVFDAATVADFYYQAAVVLRAEGKRAEALAMLAKADAAVPTAANVLRALARLSEATGDLPAARGYYARIVELFPDAADIDQLRNTLRNLTEKTGGGHATTMPDDDE